jgi:thiol-disulfide isomerase/thioredoxin
MNTTNIHKTFFAILLLATCMLYSCKPETTYTISGTVAQAEWEGAQVFLSQQIEGKLTRVDSTEVIDGAYTFIGSVEEPAYGSLMFTYVDDSARTRRFGVPLILENAKIKVTTDDEGKTTVIGGKNNAILKEHQDALKDPNQKLNEILAAYREANTAGDEELVKSLLDEYNAVNEEIKAIRFEFVKNNINNVVGRSQLGMAVSGVELEKMKEAISNATEATLQTFEVSRVVTRIEALENTAIGQPFTDLRMPDMNGKEIAISDFVGNGKYVMIDFTATWCGPCRGGKPAMIATYNKYKNKGFEIVGVWFDSTHEAWVNGHKALNLPNWPQMSDLKGWDSEGAKLYAVNGIPHSVLIDPDGIIIARGLRGDDLDKKLAELLK